MQAPHVLDLQQEARREGAIRFVEGDLEREPSVARQEVALERQRPVVEKQPQQHQPAELVRGRGGRDEELALRLAARQRAAPPSFPAARFQLKKGAEPRRRVLAGLELSPDQPALIAKPLLLSPNLLQRQAGDRAAQIALGVLAGLEEGSGRPVAQPERAPPRVQLLHQELVHRPLGRDRAQLDHRGAGLTDQPIERRGERRARALAANQRRAQETVEVLEGHQRRDRQPAVSSPPLEGKEPAEPGWSLRRARVGSIHEDELELPAGAEAPHRGLGHDGLVEDVRLEQVGGEIVEGEPMPRQLVEAPGDDDPERAAGRRRHRLRRSGKYLRRFVRAPAAQPPDGGRARHRALLSSHRASPSRCVVPAVDSSLDARARARRHPSRGSAVHALSGSRSARRSSPSLPSASAAASRRQTRARAWTPARPASDSRAGGSR